MGVRIGLWRKLNAEELMFLNCGVGEDSWESLGLQGDPTSPFWRRSTLRFFLEGIMLKLKLQYFGHLMRRVDSLDKTLMLRGIGGRRRRGRQRMRWFGCHDWLNGHGFGWTPGVGDGQGGLACCNSWCCKESDMTEWLNWTELNWKYIRIYLEFLFALVVNTLASSRVHFYKIWMNILIFNLILVFLRDQLFTVRKNMFNFAINN